MSRIAGTAVSHQWSSEYHWQGLTWLAGNLYTLAGLALLAGLAVLARRCVASHQRGGSGCAAPLPSWSTRLVPLPPSEERTRYRR